MYQIFMYLQSVIFVYVMFVFLQCVISVSDLCVFIMYNVDVPNVCVLVKYTVLPNVLCGRRCTVLARCKHCVPGVSSGTAVRRSTTPSAAPATTCSTRCGVPPSSRSSGFWTTTIMTVKS